VMRDATGQIWRGWLVVTAIAGAAAGAGGAWAARARAAPPCASTPAPTEPSAGTSKHGCCHGADKATAAKCPLHYEGAVLKVDDQAETQRLRRAMRDGLFLPWTELGRAPTPAEFAGRLKIAQADADRLLDALQACGESVGGGILRVPESELIAVAWPLSNVPTDITVTVAGGKAAFARCAIDGLGVSSMLGRRTVVEAAARDNGQRLRVVVDGERIIEAQPAGFVVVRGEGCDNMSFFSSQAAGEAWRKANGGASTLLTLAEAVARGARVFSKETLGL
jgi:alkylmercury lyase-like protein